ncbi:Folylpolyglutamate synthase [Clostridium felsineum]|nr:Folylpolyglutamate synthase [Clostridium felsineum]
MVGQKLSLAILKKYNLGGVFLNYEEAISYIHCSLKFGINLGLNRVARLLEILGNPHEKIKCIHIAGTNGKGSTTAMISQILIEAGYKVGMYTSPYIEEFEERIQVNNCNIPKEDLCSIIEKVSLAVKKLKDEGIEDPTEFEIITAAAFLYFSVKKVDYAVIEVGLGGRFDATNVIMPILTVITSVSYDHMKILGDTLAKIAYEKAGIIKDKVPLVLYPQKKEAEVVIKSIAEERKANIINVGEGKAEFIDNLVEKDRYFQHIHMEILQDQYDIKLALLGKHQINNAKTAVMVIEALKNQGLRVSKNNIINGLYKVRWRGRLDVIENNPLVVLDGAHNADGILKLKESIQIHFKYNKLILILGILADKEVKKMVELIVRDASKVITVSPHSDRAEDEEELCNMVKRYNNQCEAERDYNRAYEKAVSCYKEGDMILVCGSLYMIGDMIKLIKKKH